MRTTLMSCGEAMETRKIYRELKKEGRIARKKDGGFLTEREFSLFMRDMGAEAAKTIISGGNFVLPYRMGLIRLTKSPVSTYVDKNGVTRKRISVSWAKTKKLWAEDEEARKARKVVYFDSDWLYNIQYNKRDARFKNMGFTFIRFSKPFRKMIVKAVNDGEAVATTCIYKLKMIK